MANNKDMITLPKFIRIIKKNKDAIQIPNDLKNFGIHMDVHHNPTGLYRASYLYINNIESIASNELMFETRCSKHDAFERNFANLSLIAKLKDFVCGTKAHSKRVNRHICEVQKARKAELVRRRQVSIENGLKVKATITEEQRIAGRRRRQEIRDSIKAAKAHINEVDSVGKLTRIA